jgi:hypothetical protein
MLSREQFLGADTLTRVEIQIPELGGSVYVRVLTGAERDWLDSHVFDDEGEILPPKQRLANYRGRLVALSTCNADGTSLFTLADVETLSRMAAKVLDRIVDVAQRINGMTQEEIDTLTKNSATVPDASSGSDLP